MASNFESPSGARKRSRNEEDRQVNVAKKRRNLGQEYVSKNTGKTVAKRQVVPPCTCRKKCFEILGVDKINAIHDEYWASGDSNIQCSYNVLLNGI